MMTDEGSRKLPKRWVFQRKSLVGDFRERTLSDATQPDKLLQQVQAVAIKTTCFYKDSFPFTYSVYRYWHRQVRTY